MIQPAMNESAAPTKPILSLRDLVVFYIDGTPWFATHEVAKLLGKTPQQVSIAAKGGSYGMIYGTEEQSWIMLIDGVALRRLHERMYGTMAANIDWYLKACRENAGRAFGVVVEHWERAS